MLKIIAVVLLLLCCILNSRVSFAVAAPVQPKVVIDSTANLTDSIMQQVTSLSVKDLEKAIGHKLNFKEKIAFKILQLKQKLSGNRKSSFTDTDEKIEKKALWSKWLGIGSLIALFIPAIGFLSLPAAILAIVLGAKTIKKTEHPKYSRQGITFGIITLSLFLIIGTLVLLIIALPGG